MLQIDPRKLILMRCEEANACIHYGLHHAATLTACSGIELLLETLFEELKEELSRVSAREAHELLEDYCEAIYERGLAHEWGLGKWIDFYVDCGILNKLQNQFRYQFNVLKPATLREANIEWNKCKHSSYQITPIDAKRIAKYLTDYLEEAGFSIKASDSELRTIEEISGHWLRQWETALQAWAVKNRAKPEAEILMPLAKLLEIVVSLISDTRVTYEQKTSLMVAANYVFSSVDLMPEDELDVNGLVDDGAVLVLTLYWLWRHRGVDEEILRSLWQSDSDIIGEIFRLEQYIRNNSALLFADSRPQLGQNLTWEPISRIATEGPEALWKNYWKETY